MSDQQKIAKCGWHKHRTETQFRAGIRVPGPSTKKKLVRNKLFT